VVVHPPFSLSLFYIEAYDETSGELFSFPKDSNRMKSFSLFRRESGWKAPLLFFFSWVPEVY